MKYRLARIVITSKSEAKELLAELKNSGFDGAFII